MPNILHRIILPFVLPISFAASAQPVAEVTTNYLSTNTIWVNDSIYLIKGPVTVMPGATLTICPGTLIKFEKDSFTAIRVARGAKIIADGETAPIVFTSAESDPKPGDWPGIFILGYAPESCDTTIYGSGCTDLENIFDTLWLFGDGSPDDDSGVFRFVRIEYAGGAIFPASDEQSVDAALHLMGVGRGTTIDHIEIYKSDEVSFWFLGGTVNCSQLIAFQGGDDDFRFNRGYQGNIQFAFSSRDPQNAFSGGTNAFRIDGNSIFENGGLPLTRPCLSNFTIAGPTGANLVPGYNRLIEIRGTTQPGIFNSLLLGQYLNGFFASSASTPASYFQNDTIEIKNTIFSGVQNPLAFSGNYPAFLLENWFYTPSFYNQVLGDPAAIGLSNPFNLVQPNPLPLPNSIVWDAASFSSSARLSDPFFEPVNFIGAFGPSDWTFPWASWHNWDFNPASCLTNTKDLASRASFQVRLSPTPSDKYVRVSIDLNPINSVEWHLFDIHGNVRAFSILQPTSQIFEVNTRDLPAGVYWLRIIANGLASIRPLVVVH